MNTYIVLVILTQRNAGHKRFFVEVTAMSKTQAYIKACNTLIRSGEVTPQQRGALHSGGMKVKKPTIGGVALVNA